jgi:hypothetical protein
LGVGENSRIQPYPLKPKAQPPHARFARRASGHLALARISNSPTVLSNVLAGAALAGGLQAGPALVLVASAMFCLYTAGMYLNDVFDYAGDCARRPDRPLPSGLVSRLEATAFGIGLLGVGAGLLLPLGVGPFASGLLLAALIVAYDLWHKTNPLSPVVMAACRVMVYVTAYLALSPNGFLAPIHLVVPCLLLGGYLVGLTYVSKVEDRWINLHDPLTPTLSPLQGAREQASSPRPSGARPAKVRFTGPSRVRGGPLATATRYWPGVLVLLPAAYFGMQEAGWLVVPVLIVFVSWAAYSLSLVYRTRDRNIGGAIGRLIAGISLFDGLVLATAGAGIGVLVALVAFGSTHALQRYIKGT